MSGAAEENDLLAAEYVLGTLDEATAREVAARAQSEPELSAAIAAWQERLEPLTLLATPEAPPPAIWRRIAVTTGIAAAEPSPGVLARAWRSVALWRLAAAASAAVAAGLAAFILLRPAPERPIAALVPQGSAAAAFIAELQPDGSLRLMALEPVPAVPDKALELWALPAGASRPIPVGLLPPTGATLEPPKLPGGRTQLMVSLEPPGGSPTGLPTGPVLFAGTLQAPR